MLFQTSSGRNRRGDGVDTDMCREMSKGYKSKKKDKRKRGEKKRTEKEERRRETREKEEICICVSESV